MNKYSVSKARLILTTGMFERINTIDLFINGSRFPSVKVEVVIHQSEIDRS
jgi:hypothetical protein